MILMVEVYMGTVLFHAFVCLSVLVVVNILV